MSQVETMSFHFDWNSCRLIKRIARDLFSRMQIESTVTRCWWVSVTFEAAQLREFMEWHFFFFSFAISINGICDGANAWLWNSFCDDKDKGRLDETEVCILVLMKLKLKNTCSGCQYRERLLWNRLQALPNRSTVNVICEDPHQVKAKKKTKTKSNGKIISVAIQRCQVICFVFPWTIEWIILNATCVSALRVFCQFDSNSKKNRFAPDGMWSHPHCQCFTTNWDNLLYYCITTHQSIHRRTQQSPAMPSRLNRIYYGIARQYANNRFHHS